MPRIHDNEREYMRAILASTPANNQARANYVRVAARHATQAGNGALEFAISNGDALITRDCYPDPAQRIAAGIWTCAVELARRSVDDTPAAILQRLTRHQ